ncbi:MAG TPA: S-methyl-5'-thioadenosine phosphorylase [Symbiobacteriaceae bacterium]|jgi:5'-methylthioadenosine phosphorylase|nr:S-methyl-5'-thioadenosine phosphorylase [Symbiobacteriaceae bacterium]
MATSTVRLAIIGGTGVYDPRILENIREEVIATPYGEALVRIGTYGGEEVAFLARHGKGHTVPPHLINYRANIMALKQLGVERVIATTAVGSTNPDMKPGDFVLIDQFLDFTKNRAATFFEGGEIGVVHTDFTEPYCPECRAILAAAAKALPITVHNGGCYVCSEGPRFETPAEIRMFQKLGGDLVGMTNVPESVLAREAGLCYATVSMVTNFGAGISPTALTHEEVLEVMAENGENLKKLIMNSLGAIPKTRNCQCGNVPGAMKV